MYAIKWMMIIIFKFFIKAIEWVDHSVVWQYYKKNIWYDEYSNKKKEAKQQKKWWDDDDDMGR